MAEPPRFVIGRFSDNELVLFDEQRQESWIVYPPPIYLLPSKRESDVLLTYDPE